MIKERSISYRMAKLVALLTVFIGMMMGIIQVIWDYEDRLNNFHSQVEQILRSIEKPVQKAVFTYDQELSEDVALGLFEFPPVQSVQIIDDKNYLMADMRRDVPALTNQWVSQLFFEETYIYDVPLIRTSDFQQVIGNLKVKVSPFLVVDAFWQNALTTLFSVLVQSFILAVVLLSIFFNLVTRPLKLLANDFQDIDPQAPQGNLLRTPKSLEGSEFDEVTHAGNKMLQVIGSYLIDKKAAEIDLKLQKEETEKYLKIAEAIILKLDKTGKILMINQRGLDLLKYQHEELIDKDWFNCAISEKERSSIRQAFETLINSTKKIKSNYVENTVLTKDNEERIIFWHNVIETDEDGNTTGILSSGQDITDLKKAKHALRLTEGSQKKLEQQLRQSQKMETIGTLAGGIAHDLNNLLTPILGYSSLLSDRMKEDDPNRARILKIQQSANRAAEMIKQILTFSKRHEGELVSTPLLPVLKEVIDLIKNTSPSNIDFKFDFENNCPPVLADPTQIQQIVMNLCTNAVHAMEQSGGTLSLGLKKTMMTDMYANMSPHLEKGPYLEVTVSDEGVGMDEETIYKIFDPFFTTKSPEQGTGLGLAMVHGIVQNHKGDIFVESTPEEGSLFRIFLPITELPIHEEETFVQLSRGKSEKILLVDDEQLNTELIGEYLEDSGYKCQKFTDSLDALEAFMLSPEDFDLILTDQTMPKLSGDQLIQAIKEIRSNIPVIMMSGYSKTITADNSTEFGIDHYLDKPIALQDLNVALNDLLSNKPLN